ncbi:hypothetical protein ACW9HR_22395 [Nocardia gipuzkoensis]
MTDLAPRVPSSDAPVPLPTALSDAPTSQGMVVPYITLAHRDRSRPVWGNVDPLRLHEVLYHKLCQICGTPLGEEVIVFIRPSDFHQGVAVEPGLHPSCADYSTGTCPMLAGRMHHYHRHPGQRITRCTDPGCHCRAWAPPRPDPARDGSPTEAWYELHLPLEEYHVITVPATGKRPALTGIDLRTPRLFNRVRKVRAAADPTQHRGDPLAMLVAFGALFGGGDQ